MIKRETFLFPHYYHYHYLKHKKSTRFAFDYEIWYSQVKFETRDILCATKPTKKEKNNKNTKLARKKRNLSLFLAQKKKRKRNLLGGGWERRGRGSREKIIIDFHHLNVDDERWLGRYEPNPFLFRETYKDLDLNC